MVCRPPTSVDQRLCRSHAPLRQPPGRSQASISGPAARSIDAAARPLTSVEQRPYRSHAPLRQQLCPPALLPPCLSAPLSTCPLPSHPCPCVHACISITAAITLIHIESQWPTLDPHSTSKGGLPIRLPIRLRIRPGGRARAP